MSFSPPVGAIAFGRSGAGYPVIEVQPDRIVLRRDVTPWAVNPVAIVRWELPPSHPYPISAIVHKRHNLGWIGIVIKLVDSESVDVLWWLDKHPSLMAVSDLRPSDDALKERRVKAFAKLGVVP